MADKLNGGNQLPEASLEGKEAVSLTKLQECQKAFEKIKNTAKTGIQVALLSTCVNVAAAKADNSLHASLDTSSYTTSVNQKISTTIDSQPVLEENERFSYDDALTYVEGYLGQGFDRNTYNITLANDAITGVVKEGKENVTDYRTFEDLNIPEEGVNKDNIIKVLSYLIQDRSGDTTYRNRWNNLLDDLVSSDKKRVQNEHQLEEVNKGDTVTDGSSDSESVLKGVDQNTKDKILEGVIASLNKYFSVLKSKTEAGDKYDYNLGYNIINKYLIERGVTSTVTSHLAFSGVLDLEENSDVKLNLLSDVYYLLVALGIDSRQAWNVQETGKQEVNSFVVLDKKKALQLSDFGFDVPIEIVHKYNVAYKNMLTAGEQLGKRFETSLVEFNTFSLQEKLFAIKIFDEGEESAISDVEFQALSDKKDQFKANNTASSDPEYKQTRTDYRNAKKRTTGKLADESIGFVTELKNITHLIQTGDRIGVGQADNTAKSLLKNFPELASIFTPEYITKLDQFDQMGKDALKIKGEEIKGRLVDVEGRLVDVEGRLVDVEGRLVDVEGKLLKLEGEIKELDKDFAMIQSLLLAGK